MATNYITTTNKLKVTELDFDSIKAALKTYLQGQDEFKDYDFTGSAINILLDVLAYNTHYNGFYTNMLASEMFMDSASLRSSIVSLAKHLGYTPSSRRGSSVDLDLVFSGAADSTPLTIPRNSKFTTRVGTDAYTFLTSEARTTTYNATTGNHEVKDLEVKEGITFSVNYNVQGTTNEVFEIPNENVDTSTLVVAAGGEVYTLADDITELTSTSKAYFLQEGNQNRYEIYFGDGVVGKKPNVSELVEIVYNVSMLGQDGNGAKTFAIAEPITGATSVSISLSSGFTRTSGGAERESTSSIRIQAPRQFGLQKRLVTSNDYKTRLENDYNLVDSVRVWGGEENIPPEYGTVCVSVKPRTGYVLSQAEQNKIAKDIVKRRNIVTVNTRFFPPDYLFVIVDSQIAYDPRQTTRTGDQLKALVRSTILNYSSSRLSKFEDYFRYSVLTKLIDDTETSIQNNTTTIAMKKRIRPLLGGRSTYTIDFNNKIHRPHQGHRSVLQSSLFRYRGLDNCAIVDQDGILMVVSSLRSEAHSSINTTDSVDGVFSNIIDREVGYVDYETGEVRFTVNPTSMADQSEYLYLTAKPQINDIIPQRNTFVTIDTSDINVTCIDDTDRISENKVRSY